MKDYKVDKEKMSDAFCREVYGVVRDVPAGKVISYGEIASLLGKPQCSRMVGSLETGSFRIESALSSGSQCTGKACSRMGRTASVVAGGGRLF